MPHGGFHIQDACLRLVYVAFVAVCCASDDAPGQVDLCLSSIA